VNVGEGDPECHDHVRRHVRSVRLPSESCSVKVARDEVATALRRMAWPEERIDQAKVVVSELVTNAVLHARTAFVLTVRVAEGAVIEVSDEAPTRLPRRIERDDNRPGGMGLHLVDAMSAEWGVERDPERKVVWARLPDRNVDPLGAVC
jgi:anti-sigma regulatory factor (Ser/Thr protein kinase)